MDIAAYNAFVLWVTVNPNWNHGKSHVRRLFLRELGTQLLNDHVSARLAQSEGKCRRIQQCVHRSSISLDQSIQADGDNSRGRCRLCPHVKECKTTRRCDICRLHVCKQHSVTLMTCAGCAPSSHVLSATASY